MACGGNSPLSLFLSPPERAPLEHWPRSTTIPAGLATRGQLILLRAEGLALAEMARRLAMGRRIVRQGLKRCLNQRLAGLSDKPGRGRQPLFSPAGAGHLVKMACERPDTRGRSLSPWDGLELARQLAREGIVDGIAAETVRRILEGHQLKPWRHHLWLAPTTPRATEFCGRVAAIVDLYTRPLRHDERVRCVEEKTSRPPRPRRHATRPATPELPHRVEHAYRRAGALTLWAAFDTRTGQVDGPCHPRQRQRECIAFLEHLDAEMPATIKALHRVCDHARAHHGQQVCAWLHSHPRLVVPFTPVPGAWRNHVEQWFSILQRKRLRLVDFASTADLQAKLAPCIAAWTEGAHPVKWTTKSVAKVMADASARAA